MKKNLMIAALTLLALAGASAATTSKEKVQIVYQVEASGRWQVYLFGPMCADPKGLKVVPPEHSTGPIEVDCEVK